MNKLQNLEELDIFLDSRNLHKLSHDDIHNLHGLLTEIRFKLVVNTLSTKKSSDLDGFTAKFYRTFQEELIPVLLKLFKIIVRQGILPNFCEGSTTYFQNQKKMPWGAIDQDP